MNYATSKYITGHWQSSAAMISPVQQMADEYPKQSAILWHDAQGDPIQITYGQLNKATQRLAQQFRDTGLTSGDRLACISANRVEMIILYWACVQTGVIFFPISPKFPQKQLFGLLAKFQAKALWQDAKQIPLSELPSGCVQIDLNLAALLSTQANIEPSQQNSAEIELDAATNLILTSGSSGTPKGALHSFKNHLASALGSQTLIPLDRGERWLLTLPLFHIGGLAIVNRCTLAGACVVLADKQQSLQQQVTDDSITHLSLVPTQAHRLLESWQSHHSIPNVKALLLGGGTISPELIDKLAQLNIPNFCSYGMTEMSSQICTAAGNTHASCGKALPYRELKIEQGKIFVKGETLFLGYLQTDGSIERPLISDGWFDTQDLGLWNSKGELQVLGRSDNMFISGGENIHPEEIEKVLLMLAGVSQAIVFAENSAEFGQLPAAIIEGKLPVEAELNHHLTKHLARFKRPRRYYSWPDIPQTGLKLPRKQIIDAVTLASKEQ